MIKKIGIAPLILVLYLFPVVSLAGPGDVPDEKYKLKDTLTTGPKGVIELIERISNWIFAILIVLAVIFILMAAFNYLTSQGSEEKLSKAHKTLLYAAVAVAVAVLARGIVAATRILIETPTRGS